jgi:hypothetical protein
MKPRRSHIFEKAKHGHYLEPSWCSARLFEVDDFGPPGSWVLDPACGWGTILATAREAGYRPMGIDVVDRLHRRELDLGRVRFFKDDFLNRRIKSEAKITSIVCNPPFDRVEEYCATALAVAEYKVAMLCLLRRLPAAHWLGGLPLETIYVLTPRPSMPPGSYITAGNKPGGGTQDFVWIVIRKGYRGQPKFKWLHRDGALDGHR